MRINLKNIPAKNVTPIQFGTRETWAFLERSTQQQQQQQQVR